MQNYDLVLVFARVWMEFFEKNCDDFLGEGLQRRRRLWVSVLNSKLVLPTGDAVVDYY